HVEGVPAVRLVEIVTDVGEILARNAEEVGVVEVAGCEHEALRADALLAAAAGHDALEAPVAPLGRHETAVRLEAYAFRPGHAAVVLQRFLPRRLLARAHQRVAADLYALWRRKEGHRDRIARCRVHEHRGFQV